MFSDTVRPPACAGTFYDADPDTLRASIEQHLRTVTDLPEVEGIRGIVSPHAGFVFSGPPAAHGYRLLHGRGIKRAIVVAPSHRVWFNGVAAWLGESFQTPLGAVPLDNAFTQRLMDKFEFITDQHRPHLGEHSLEVQIPFLQVVLEDWELVPLLVADQTWTTMRRLGEALATTLADDPTPSVIVASSDLHHGEDIEICRASDARCADAVRDFNPEEFLLEADVNYQACGAGPIAAVMLASQLLDAKQSRVLSLTNSSETFPSLTDRVVGYLSAVFSES